MMSEEARIYLENFAYNVFNYYNGKINIVNNGAILDVNWASNINASGWCRIPNVVVINIGAIYKFYNGDIETCKVSIIETIIHELTHMDQVIDYTKYAIVGKSYTEYANSIENACNYQALMYMYSNLDEINYIFGVNISRESVLECIKAYYNPNDKYVRRTYDDHFNMCMVKIFEEPMDSVSKINKVEFDNITIKRSDIGNYDVLNNECAHYIDKCFLKKMC